MKACIGLLIIFLVLLSVFAVSRMPKRISGREAYALQNANVVVNPNSKAPFSALFPPGPRTTPPSAYAELEAPKILTSENNPQTSPTLKAGKWGTTYSDQHVCNTPWSLPAYNNDSCAQYGIGEMAKGPPGHQFCVCETKLKNGQKVGRSIPTSENIVIGVGAVCTQDSQCSTNYCGTRPGQFSKMCLCPPGLEWDDDNQKCIGGFQPNPDEWSTIYDEHVESWRPPPEGAIPSSGALCASNKDCGLGEACTPDNFCASQLIDAMSGGASALEHADNYFNIGANCLTNEQCANNMECLNYRCSCPQPLVYEWYSRTCQCVDGSKTPLNGQCVKPSQIPRTFCPTTPPSFAKGWQDCGLGEVFVPGSHACACVTDLKTIHPGKIGAGGKCQDSTQCSSGNCQNVDGVNVCVEPQVSLAKIAAEEYL